MSVTRVQLSSDVHADAVSFANQYGFSISGLYEQAVRYFIERYPTFYHRNGITPSHSDVPTDPLHAAIERALFASAARTHPMSTEEWERVFGPLWRRYCESRQSPTPDPKPMCVCAADGVECDCK